MHRLRFNRWMLLLLFGGVALVVLADCASAVNWDGGGQTTEWLEGNGVNWQFDQLPSFNDVATIAPGVATITGSVVPAVSRLEVGLGATAGSLTMTGPAMLEVLNDAAVASQGVLNVGPGPAELFAIHDVLNSGNVLVVAGGRIRANQTYQQNNRNNATVLDGGEIVATTTLVNAGQLRGNGTIIGNLQVGAFPSVRTATISPGIGNGTGVINVNGDLDLASVARYRVDIDATGGVENDQIVVSGTASLGGTLHLNLVGTLPPGQFLDIVVADDIAPGTFFDDIEGLTTDDGSLIVTFIPGGFGFSDHIRVYPSSDLGDMNGDEDIDELDAPIFAHAIRDDVNYIENFSDSDEPVDCNLAPVLYFDEFGQLQEVSPCGAAERGQADMDQDSDYTAHDIRLFLEAVENDGGNAVAALQAINNVLSQPVPEPTTVSLLALGCMGLCRLRSRQLASAPGP